MRRFYEPVTQAIGKDEPESERVCRKIGAWPKQCYFNARRAIQKLGDYADASYVEGYVVCKDGFGPIEHGWIVKDRVIIDPTLPDSVAIYFSGLEFVGRDGIISFLATPRGKECRKSPFFYAFGWGGQESPSMASAYREATESMLALHRDRGTLLRGADSSVALPQAPEEVSGRAN